MSGVQSNNTQNKLSSSPTWLHYFLITRIPALDYTSLFRTLSRSLVSQTRIHGVRPPSVPYFWAIFSSRLLMLAYRPIAVFIVVCTTVGLYILHQIDTKLVSHNTPRQVLPTTEYKELPTSWLSKPLLSNDWTGNSAGSTNGSSGESISRVFRRIVAVSSNYQETPIF
jgi:hypothetical protein